MADDDRLKMADIKPFGLRMRPELKEMIERAAASGNRSMNAEIIHRLEESFSKPREIDVLAIIAGDPSNNIPRGLYRRIEDAAEAHGQSVNDEIVSALEERYPAGADFADFFYTTLRDFSEEWDTTKRSDLISGANQKLRSRWPHVKATFVQSGDEVHLKFAS